MPSPLPKLMSFFTLGVIIVFFVIGVIFLSYLLILGAIVGFVLFLIHWIKETLANKKKTANAPESKPGRIIDHQE